MPVILEIKLTMVIIKKFLHQYHPPYTRRVSFYGVLNLQFLDSYNICIIYLHVIDTCLKVFIAIFYFCHSKNSSNIIKNVFDSISMYSWKNNSSLTNVRSKYGIPIFYKQHFYKQCQAETGMKNKQKLCNILRLFFAIWKLFIVFLHVIIQNNRTYSKK